LGLHICSKEREDNKKVISVKVKGIAPFSKLMGKDEKVFSINEGTKLKELIDILVHKYGELFAHMIYNDDREIRKEVRFLLNGKDVLFLGGYDIELKEGDQLRIFPPLCGG
jgi:MoaD family protein